MPNTEAKDIDELYDLKRLLLELYLRTDILQSLAIIMNTKLSGKYDIKSFIYDSNSMRYDIHAICSNDKVGNFSNDIKQYYADAICCAFIDPKYEKVIREIDTNNFFNCCTNSSDATGKYYRTRSNLLSCITVLIIPAPEEILFRVNFHN